MTKDGAQEYIVIFKGALDPSKTMGTHDGAHSDSAWQCPCYRALGLLWDSFANSVVAPMVRQRVYTLVSEVAAALT